MYVICVHVDLSASTLLSNPEVSILYDHEEELYFQLSQIAGAQPKIWQVGAVAGGHTANNLIRKQCISLCTRSSWWR